MKAIFALFAVLFTYSAEAQNNAHPILHQLVRDADVVAVAKLREPQLWVTSELIVMTGQSTAHVERTLKGKELPTKIIIRVVRNIDIEHVVSEEPQLPEKAVGFPVTPVIPTKFTKDEGAADATPADKVIVFLRRSENGDLSAVDGFLYSLPYSPELASAVLSATKNQEAQQDAP